MTNPKPINNSYLGLVNGVFGTVSNQGISNQGISNQEPESTLDEEVIEN
jgi:hypothetical protein